MLFFRWVGQDRIVAAGMVAEGDLGPGGLGHTDALRSERDAAIGGDFNRGALTPDIGPPGAGGFGAQDGALFPLGLAPSGAGRLLEFPVNFLLIAVVAQGGNVFIGDLQVADIFGGEISGQAVLPELMFPLHFALGLGRWGVAEGDIIKLQRPAQLGQGFGDLGGKQAVIIHIDFQGQAIFRESRRQEI